MELNVLLAIIFVVSKVRFSWSYEDEPNCSYSGQDGKDGYICDEASRRSGQKNQFSIISQGGGIPDDPTVIRPHSQSYTLRQISELKGAREYWQSMMNQNEKNCMLCELRDSGQCNAMPSCVYCEETVTASCERSAPCLRCTVIKNPFFKCNPGEKYMDECDSCRCTDGRSGWCTNMYCEFRVMYFYAMKLSDGEY